MKKKGIFNDFRGRTRIDILQYCKENKIDEARFHPVSILKWEDVYNQITDQFVDKTRTYKQPLHWVNTNGSFQKDKPLEKWFDSSDCWDWVLDLPQLIQNPDKMAYLLVEEGYKFWVFEGDLHIIAQILYEGLYDSDYYVADRHYQWLITCNHEQIVYFVGRGFDFSHGFPKT